MTKETPLTSLHRALGAQTADFAGFDMPIVYTSIQAEHAAVRTRAGLFDLCHMGRVEVRGPDRVPFLERLVTGAVGDMMEGQARYALFCESKGGVIDDLVHYFLPDRIFVVINAANRAVDLAWMHEHRESFDVEITDVSDALAMIALQGPDSERLLASLYSGPDLGRLAYYHIAQATVTGVATLVARTGYTGEDGFEFYFASEHAERVWNALSGLEVAPVGLGARDTLRTEAAMPLYGHELTRETNPLEAGLGFAVKLEGKGDWIGREALARVKAAGPARKLVCFVADGKRIPRHAQPILTLDGEPAGQVTSGTFSPTLGKPIGMGYVPAAIARAGTRFLVDVRGHRLPVEIVKRPFYKREKTEP